jgi:hypothetical protein
MTATPLIYLLLVILQTTPSSININTRWKAPW